MLRPSMRPRAADIDRVVAAVDDAADEVVAFTADLIRIPTVNPPGDHYEDCAHLVGARLQELGLEVEYLRPEGLREHTSAHPRVNVIGTQPGHGPRPLVHLNG